MIFSISLMVLGRQCESRHQAGSGNEVSTDVLGAAPGTAFNLGCCVTRVEPIQAVAKSVQRHFPFCFKLLEFKHKLL